MFQIFFVSKLPNCLSSCGLYLHCGSEPHLYDNHIAGGERGAGADQSRSNNILVNKSEVP